MTSMLPLPQVSGYFPSFKVKLNDSLTVLLILILIQTIALTLTFF